jgi:superfamily II DNA or RNA helicase
MGRGAGSAKTKMNATLTDLLWLERDEIPHSQLEAVRQKLTVQPRTFEGEAAEPICLLVEENNRVGFPVYEGLKFFQMEAGLPNLAAAFLAVDNRTAEGLCIKRYLKRRPAPRDPQQERFFKDMARQAVARPAVLCEGPTGSGKTVAGVDTIAEIGTTALILVPRKRIAKQWVEALEGFLGIHPSKIGLVQEGTFQWKNKAVVVAVIHNLVNKDPAELPEGFLDYFGTVIWDECLPAGTKVDGRPIESIKVVDYVKSLSWKGEVEPRKVTRTWCRPLRHRLVKVRLSCGREVICTEDHLVFTSERGFIPAKDLHPGNAAIILDYGQNTDTDTSLPGVRSSRGGDYAKAKTGILQGCRLLLRRAWGSLQKIVMGNESAEVAHGKQRGSQRADAVQKSNARVGHAGKGISHLEEDRAPACHSRRERNGSDRSPSSPVAVSSGVESGALRAHQHDARDRAVNPLQDRHSASGGESSGRDRRAQPQREKTCSGPQENRVFGFSRVESVAVLKPGSDGKYTSHCPAGKVYDLEVEGNHNFFANGILVHNCHNLGARTFSKSMGLCRARHRIAMTATPERGDGCEQVFFDYFGPPSVVYEGVAMPCTCRVFNFFWAFPQPQTGKGAFKKRPKGDLNSKPRSVLRKIIITSERRNKFLAKLIKQLYDAGRHVLVIGDEVLHLQVLMGCVMDLGVDGEQMGLYTGSYRDAEGKDRKMKDAQLDWVAANSRVIFATYGMAGEALDIPRLDAGIDVTPHSSGVQPVGRIRRVKEGKPTPLWLTVRDVGIRVFENAAATRLRGLREANVTIIEQQTNGTQTNNQNRHAA